MKSLGRQKDPFSERKLLDRIQLFVKRSIKKNKGDPQRTTYKKIDRIQPILLLKMIKT